jgi:hypothetical protein
LDAVVFQVNHIHISRRVYCNTLWKPKLSQLYHDKAYKGNKLNKLPIWYLVFQYIAEGLHQRRYKGLAEQLKKHESQELAHALEVARQVDYLGGDPTMKGKEAEYCQDSKTRLEIDLRAEQETIKNYRENTPGGSR